MLFIFGIFKRWVDVWRIARLSFGPWNWPDWCVYTKTTIYVTQNHDKILKIILFLFFQNSNTLKYTGHYVLFPSVSTSFCFKLMVIIQNIIIIICFSLQLLMFYFFLPLHCFLIYFSFKTTFYFLNFHSTSSFTF